MDIDLTDRKIYFNPNEKELLDIIKNEAKTLKDASDIAFYYGFDIEIKLEKKINGVK